jgi:opacity protein-like surface antigen
VFQALPDSARSDTAKTIAEAAAAAALVGVVCSSLALTAEDEIDEADFARRGWLVGVSGSYAFETFEDDAERDFQKVLGPAVNLSVDDSAGFNGRVGYRCHRRISAEVETEWLHGFDADLTQPGVDQLAKVEYDPIVITANVKGYFLTGRYQPFLLVGAGAMTAETKIKNPVGLAFTGIDDDSDNAFAMRFGGGIDIYATENVAVTVDIDYVLPFGNLDHLDYVTIGWGVEYRF